MTFRILQKADLFAGHPQPLQAAVLSRTSRPRQRTTSSLAAQRILSMLAARFARLIVSVRASATEKQTACSSTSLRKFGPFDRVLPHTDCVNRAENTNYNPMSPYTFYDAACPAELPVRKRQLDISLGLGPGEISSACSCFITKGPASTTVTRTVSSAVVRTSTVTSTVTRTRGVGAE